jgi:hypothetical protein
MSRAFVKEGESEQLKHIAPNMASLQIYLKREYGQPCVNCIPGFMKSTKKKYMK